MKKAFFTAFCIGILAAAVSAAARTAPDFPRYSFGAGGGLMTTSQFGNGPLFVGSFTAVITGNFAAEIRGGYFEGDVAGRASGLSKGKFSTVPIQLGLQFRYPVGDKLVPYVAAGGGYFINDFALDATIISNWSAAGFTITENLDPCIGFHFGAGADFLVTPNIILNLDIRYTLAKAEGSWKLADKEGAAEESGVLKNLDINPLAAVLSVRYGF